jgi:3-dehydroquinate dehydratase/shikimate dehydrogenase
MLCISVAPVSRKLAKADLLNAAGQCDQIELCLDHFLKEPDVGDILHEIPKPIIVACRRARDGGRFEGTDEERLTLLRQAIVASPAYVELDLDAAARIPRFGKTRRLVSFTTPDGPPDDFDALFEEAAKVHADAVRFAWPTPTFDETWPMLELMGQRRSIPTVCAGIGRAAVTVALLGRALEAPWAYAGLEKGLETLPGQPTVAELREIYAWDDLGPKTRFVGVAAPVDAQSAAVIRALNAGFRSLGERYRCLPLPLQSFERIRERLEQLKINALLVAPELAPAAALFAAKREGSAEPSGYADLLLRQPDGWTGYCTLWRHAVYAAEERLGAKGPDDRPLDRRNVMVIGAGGLARAFIHGVQRRKGIDSITGPDDKAAQKLAQQFSVRHVPFAALYDTLCDVVVIAQPDIAMGHRKEEINPAYFRESITVMDLSAMPACSAVLEEARSRGGRIVDPAAVFRKLVAAQFESITGKPLPTAAFDELPSGPS